jgi:hypothetical protein
MDRVTLENGPIRNARRWAVRESASAATGRERSERPGSFSPCFCEERFAEGEPDE